MYTNREVLRIIAYLVSAISCGQEKRWTLFDNIIQDRFIDTDTGFENSKVGTGYIQNVQGYNSYDI